MGKVLLYKKTVDRDFVDSLTLPGHREAFRNRQKTRICRPADMFLNLLSAGGCPQKRF